MRLHVSTVMKPNFTTKRNDIKLVHIIVIIIIKIQKESVDP